MILPIKATNGNHLYKYSKNTPEDMLPDCNIVTIKLYSLTLGIDICYHQTMNNTKVDLEKGKKSAFDYEKVTYLFKKDGTFTTVKMDTEKITLAGNHDIKQLFFYDFDGLYHFNYVRFHNNALVNLKNVVLLVIIVCFVIVLFLLIMYSRKLLPFVIHTILKK